LTGVHDRRAGHAASCREPPLVRSSLQTDTRNNSPRSIILGSTPSAEAARDSAERRWNIGLLNLFGEDPVLYGAVVDAIDSSLKSMATDTEMKRPGAGLECLLRELSKRGILSSRA
jgi:hypothetical protein